MNDERMNLDSPEFRLSLLLDGDLSPDEAARVEREAAADPALRRTLEQYRRVNDWVRAKARPSPEFDAERFHAQVMWRCGATRRSTGGAMFYRIGLPLAAAAALGWAFLLRSPTLTPERPPVVAAVSEQTSPPVPLPAPAVTTAEPVVVEVVFDHAPPEEALVEALVEAGEEGDSGSFVIAAVGARPLGEPPDDEGSTPTF